MHRIHLAVIVSVALALVLFLAACGSGTGVIVNERARDFAGGALSSFGGVDGDNTTARSTARDLMVGREFDCIGNNFQLTAGTANTAAAAASTRFGGGMGTLAINADEGVLTLEVFNIDPDVVDASVTGYFSITEAQRAVQDAGASFLVDWEIEFEEDGVDYLLTAQQILAGVNWTEF